MPGQGFHGLAADHAGDFVFTESLLAGNSRTGSFLFGFGKCGQFLTFFQTGSGAFLLSNIDSLQLQY
jgi:hypothetical protein